MQVELRELLRLDLGAIDLRRGLSGLVAILVFTVFVAVFGNIGMVATMAALFVIMADRPGPLRDRGFGIAVMTVFGSGIALVGIWAGPEHIWMATALIFVVTAVATLAAGLGAAAATRGLLLSIWAVVAISLAGDTESAVQLAVAFAAGGIVAALIIWLRSRTLPEPSLEAGADAEAHTLLELVRTSLGWYSILRATAAAAALFIGATLFPDHAIWGALTVLLVMKPKASDAVAAGVLRTLGTLLGVLAAEVVLALSGGEDLIVIGGFMVAAFGMIALKNVNYAVFVAFLTAVLVLSQELAGGTGEAAASDRLWATVLGAAIAFVGLGVGRWGMNAWRAKRATRASDAGTIDVADDETPG
jgi:hypothetical protein